jgi:hypothetical protein
MRGFDHDEVEIVITVAPHSGIKARCSSSHQPSRQRQASPSPHPLLKELEIQRLNHPLGSLITILFLSRTHNDGLVILQLCDW